MDFNFSDAKLCWFTGIERKRSRRWVNLKHDVQTLKQDKSAINFK